MLVCAIFFGGGGVGLSSPTLFPCISAVQSHYFELLTNISCAVYTINNICHIDCPPLLAPSPLHPPRDFVITNAPGSRK